MEEWLTEGPRGTSHFRGGRRTVTTGRGPENKTVGQSSIIGEKFH